MGHARFAWSIIVSGGIPAIDVLPKIRTTLGPEDLLFKLKEIESEMGRKPHIRYGPRIIDLDLLFYGSVRHNTSILTVPHPQLHERDFVLGPLMDICPDFVRTMHKYFVITLLT
jgi:7,8-dihydro-6-hydroxymethylpterin-pyrophosphokinase